ncbi:response regulator [Schauerella aestuarii]|uniref:response regulator n=1 Tax=Schauerella aestuarii TaxID=2511204 RepID=UPI00136D47A5|nr:two-component system response regulator [Achromobacter aestuarii]MYZ44107.1 two-component system response regulator [Achromobacter aestuarii]
MTVLNALPTILVVDDEAANLQLLKHILQADYQLLFAKNGERALELAREQRPDLILLDVMMPGMSGYQVCAALKTDAGTESIPVIFVTALTHTDDEVQAFGAGAVDFITKPVSPLIVKARVRTHLSLVRMDELKETRLEIVHRLGLAAEYRDNETGQHVIRMSRYAQLLGRAAGMSESVADDLLNAAPLHDIGKIGIPDSILLKPGPLSADEWAVMKTHAEIGARIIGEHRNPMLAMARRIALSHHEKWDGTGYPYGLVGDAIPFEARIVAVCDVLDALTSRRPYKEAWPTERALEHIDAQRGKHFEPAVVDLLMENLPAVETVRQQCRED